MPGCGTEGSAATVAGTRGIACACACIATADTSPPGSQTMRLSLLKQQMPCSDNSATSYRGIPLRRAQRWSTTGIQAPRACAIALKAWASPIAPISQLQSEGSKQPVRLLAPSEISVGWVVLCTLQGRQCRRQVCSNDRAYSCVSRHVAAPANSYSLGSRSSAWLRPESSLF